MDVKHLLPIEPVEISVLLYSAERTISHDVNTFFGKLLAGLKFSLESENFADGRFPIDGNTNSQIPFRIHNRNVHGFSNTDVAICFYPSETSRDLAVEFSERSFQPNDFPFLFVGIKADGTNTTSILPDSEQSPGNPLTVNDEYMEWSVESGEMEAKQIFEKAVCMGIRYMCAHILSRIVAKFHLQDKDLQLLEKENVFSSTSLMNTIPILCRLWELRRIVLTYRSHLTRSFVLPFLDVRPLEFRSCCTIVYRSLSDWIPEQNSTLEVKPSLYTFTADVGAISNLLSRSTAYPLSLVFYQQGCNFITQVFNNQTAQLNVRSLVINQCFGSLKFQFLSSLKALEHLVIVDTEVDPTKLVFNSRLCESIKHLVLARCRITEVPEAIATLINLTVLNINDNSITKLPGILGNLRKLDTFLFEFDTIRFPPINVLRRKTPDIMKYLQAFGEDDEPVPHNEAKLIVVGQEGVGKSTLIKAMRRSAISWFKHTKPSDKTDGIDISKLKLGGTRFKVYDMAGDVEYLNTHSLFLSSDCLHLAVFDMSQITVSKATRSAELFCRLELWLQMIAAQNPESYVIIVGTHADDPRITTEIIASIRKHILQLLRKYQHSQQQRVDGCIVCNPEELPENLRGTDVESTNLTSCIPHVLDYFEVSSITKYPRAPLSVKNKNLDELRSAVSSTNANISRLHGQIPKKWLAFYESISHQKVEPTLPLPDIFRIAKESEVPPDMVESMLRFFHSQGNLLWYEDIPEMKDVVVMKPQWLSDQLRTLISYRSSDAISDGILHTASLSEVWADISEETRPKLLSLFRSVGLCFSISDVEELFPCNLPIGWPDREKWPPLPPKNENQTSLLFTFSFLPPTFFTRLIVEVNKKRQSFPSSAKPLYYRFHILYVTKEQDGCDAHKKQPQVAGEDTDPQACLHTVHYEVMPHNNSLKVAIRGSSPCCIVSSIRSAMESVQSCYYPGITLEMRLICPICEIKKVRIPATFRSVDSSIHEGICSQGWHKIGTINDILRGKYSPGDFVASELHQATRIGGEILKDHICPKLFIVLPINNECLSFMDRLVHTYLRDGFAVHLLCECPDQWHFVDSPGFRIGKPKQFFEKYGKHLCSVLRTIAKLGAPLRAAGAVDPHCRIGTVVAEGANSVACDLEALLDNAFEKYPHLKPSPDSIVDNLESAVNLQRGELAKFLEVVDKDHQFGPLVCTYVDKRNEWLWICEEHKKHFDTVKH